MSRTPHGEGAQKTIELARRMGELSHQVPVLQRAVKSAQRALDETVRDLTETRQQLKKHLEEMDCDSIGNFGWEGRIGWLIGEIIRQIDEEKSK